MQKNQAVGRYLLSFQTEPFFRAKRYHWMICSVHNSDELVSWGHAATQELAKKAAANELKDLSLGLTQGEQATSKSATH
jgi:hypothetical protein